MPVIGPLAFAGDVLDADELADELVLPSVPPTTYEVLNGGCDQDQYDGGNSSIEAGVFQPGSFVTGMQLAFEDWHIVYAAQMTSQDAGAESKYRIALRACVAYYLPWEASLVHLAWNFPTRQEAYQWDTSSSNNDHWDIRASIDSTKLPSLYMRLPYGQQYTDVDANARKAAGDTLDTMAENRWRYVSQCTQVSSGALVERGVHRFRVTLWVDVYVADPFHMKCVIPAASVAMLAIR
jgi:hypothetical protein